ncbi:hypothetical protein [Chryseobacterium gregarium]|uniref:hypothetical protein n=1 Tax=Chryseobacterium gregarium TaxID=456299 RepID=UPI0021CDB70E|nr:hypothetical protein [Chryseobacterium gregarium]
MKSLSSLPYSDDLAIVKKQIIRSVTSVAANYRAEIRKRKISLWLKKLMKLSCGLKSLKN